MNLYAVGTNVPGYLPTDPESVTVVHADTASEQSLTDSARALAVLVAESIATDGDLSAADVAADPECSDDDYAGDSGMADLARSAASGRSPGGGEFLGDLVSGIARALREGTEYSYVVHWHGLGDVAYWVMPATDATRCTDADGCLICDDVPCERNNGDMDCPHRATEWRTDARNPYALALCATHAAEFDTALTD